MLALLFAGGFASGIYIANNGPDMITLVGIGIAWGTAASFFSLWVVWTERVLHEDQGD